MNKDSVKDNVLEWLPEKKPGQLFLMGGILPRFSLHRMCNLAITVNQYAAEVLMDNGFQKVSYSQLVPADEDELLAIKVVIHHVDEEKAVQRPAILPEELPEDIVHDELDPRILDALEYTQTLLTAQS